MADYTTILANIARKLAKSGPKSDRFKEYIDHLRWMVAAERLRIDPEVYHKQYPTKPKETKNAL